MDDISRRARTWIGRGQGLSAVTAWCCLRGVDSVIVDSPSHASDITDLVGLLAEVPEWRVRLQELSVLSEDWRAVVDKWEMLSVKPASLRAVLREDGEDYGSSVRFVFAGRVGGPKPDWATEQARLAGLDEEARIDAWISGSDTGLSSRAIWATMLGLEGIPKSHPRDPVDLGRCLRLLAVFPKWRPRIQELGALSPEWGRLVAAWTKLEATMAHEAGIAWEKASAAPKTFELMNSILRNKRSLF